ISIVWAEAQDPRLAPESSYPHQFIIVSYSADTDIALIITTRITFQIAIEANPLCSGWPPIPDSRILYLYQCHRSDGFSAQINTPAELRRHCQKPEAL